MSIQTSTYREVSLCSRCLPVCWINGELRIFSVDHFMFICKGCLGDRRVGTSSTYQIILHVLDLWSAALDGPSNGPLLCIHHLPNNTKLICLHISVWFHSNTLNISTQLKVDRNKPLVSHDLAENKPLSK